ncbi:VPA1262 family protein [Niveispirillum sp. BGYR6]|uniref:VPA1262 family protein n=1 Tax=Niveispirillum sp. BGYR6 TaxID=2971249 RepID=UPI0022B96E24|nr:VPA1262 family protein [Niveispirillum sp. BGYR6]MDG5494829.1 VPA1262 family protein [Niveispirillum sp. BGYR6]
MQSTNPLTVGAPVLEDLLNDSRLGRLFSQDSRDCALQLWIMQIKSEQSVENRLVYGRLLPYRHANNRWSASNDDAFQTFGHVEAQLIRLNLYVKSVHCAELLRRLGDGKTIAAISDELKFDLSKNLRERLGETALAAKGLAFRPVAFLINRDAYERGLPSSPHGDAGAFSASLAQYDKQGIFRLGQDYNIALTAAVVSQLNAETGLDFGAADIARFGDLELLVFPTLDDFERPLLAVGWAETSFARLVRFNPTQLPHYSGFQFHLKVTNNGLAIYSAIATATPDQEGVFEHKFELSDQLCAMSDSTEVEVFGFLGEQMNEGVLCCRWRVGHLREMNFQLLAVGHGVSPVKFDWLEKTTKPSDADRVKAALTIDHGMHRSSSLLGGRQADPWVPANRNLVSLFSKLHPQKSEGQFFLRWGPSGGQGRLEFVEWLKALLAKYAAHQVVIFDPYFEVSGLNLVLLCAAEKADYIVFRSLPKSTKEDSAAEENSPSREFGDTAPEQFNNLVTSCELNRHLMKHIKLRIYGLKNGRLHDRYILITGKEDGLPVTGFNLSNSLQNAAENYPMLVTPIPADVLLKVEEYKSGLVREAREAQESIEAKPEGEIQKPLIRLLFDSSVSASETPRLYEPLRFLEMPQAGDVLSVWTNESSLRGLNGDLLKERMAALDLLSGESLTLPETEGLQNYLDRRAGNFLDFTADWEVLGQILAHSNGYEFRSPEPGFDHNFLEFLGRFLNKSFRLAPINLSKGLTTTEPKVFVARVETLLTSAYAPHHFSRPAKYAALSWSELFAIRFLWWYAPDTLLAITEAQAAGLPSEPQAPDVIRLSLLSQIVSEIALSVQFNITEGQRARLIQSNNGLLQWMGLNAIVMLLEKPEGLATALQIVANFSYPEQVRTLGWMVHHLARDPNKAEIYRSLVTALHEALPETIPLEDLKRLVDSMRGHMRYLSWAEPWLFQDVVYPLLRNQRANTDDACEIWVHEVVDLLNPELDQMLGHFDRAREGQTTTIAALLFAYSNPPQQQASLKSMHAILKRQRRIIQQPLANTSDWTKWNEALVVSMWVLTFARWGQYYLRIRDMDDSDLDKLSQSASELAMVRSMDEWRSHNSGKVSELALFLDQVMGLLAEASGR